MTKARDLANIISGGFTADDIPNLDTAKITTGTFADARIAASNVSQHATSFDDNKLVNDISTLALRQASDQDKSAYNTNSQFVDVFQDATGLGTILNARRNASEYIDSTNLTITTPTITHDADQTGVDGDYNWYKWTDTSGTGSFSTNTATTVEWLVVAGGGGGGGDNYGSGVGGSRGSGGGGAGGLRTSYGSTSGGGASAEADLNLGAGTSYTITVGAGGTAGTDSGSNGGNGGTSSIAGSDITDITTVGGGGGSMLGSNTGSVGGSGGGGASGSNGGVGTANQGYGAGNSEVDSNQGSGGGGGAGGAGTNGSSNWSNAGGAGGNGLSVSITGSAVVYAAGGGGGRNSGSNNGGSSGLGGNGGDDGNGGAGTTNTGSGGGGSGGVTSSGGRTGGVGGSGVVILRVPTQVATTTYNATGSFESNAITASSSTSSMGAIITYQDNAGTNALNTDIVLQLSADGGSNYSTATLTALPDFSTGIKMAKVNDLAVTAGTSLKYKLSFANQASGSKEARIRGVSLQY